VSVGSVWFVLEGGFAYPMTHTISADEVAADLPPEQMLAKTFANLSNDLRAHLEGQGQVQ
jgi:hypothetical protein